MNKAEAFLKKHHMHWSQIDPEQELEKLLREMETVRAGGAGSVKMIPTYVGDYSLPDRETEVTVIDIGGTNVRSAVMTILPDGRARIGTITAFLTPGVKEPTDTAGFFSEIVRGCRQDLRTGSIGICFSLATIPQKDRDAVMVAGGKQIKVTDMLGKRVGESFREAMIREGIAEICPEGNSAAGNAAAGNGVSEKIAAEDVRITVINDTVAAALGGAMEQPQPPDAQEGAQASNAQPQASDTQEGAQASDTQESAQSPGAPRGRKGYSGYVGFIYGTGTNICYREPSGELINVESGAYTGFPAGDMDDAYDKTLIDTGDDRFEKMVSGGYQGGLMMHILEKGAAEGMIRRTTYERLRDTGGITSKDISAFAKDPESSGRIADACAETSEKEFLLELFDLITERSARLCSIVITAALLRAGIGTDHKAPAFITAEGSTFLKQKDFREKLERQMDALAGEKYRLFWEFHTVENAVMKGIAAAAAGENYE